MKRLAAAMVIALWATVLAGQWQATSHDQSVHLPHAVSAAIGDSSTALMLDHPHVSDGSTPHTLDNFSAAVLPRTAAAAAAAAALSVVALVLGCIVLCGCAAVRVQRGPPDRHGALLAGQELLLRICIARR
ncbi:hypothetical protein [Mycolicibacterium alvei]|jgi:hypothetical protein|uniref:Lipoprotein LpqS n=1 Tax=Mycolicibacterium alvei TaxID=67081 RepID=A0A6N4V2F1_9MYCO|nr:hypothetical protein [Mycolicibacterium alvei]MCV7003646.1 hypothetical protein [Mycolicibacterium alvei]BBX29912.1 hypothetical protein MALV_50370 [Mycolicibacterium alvei]